MQSIRIMEISWACSSAGRAPALQVCRVNPISSASGVAYAETRGAITLLNWTDIGPKRSNDHALGYKGTWCWKLCCEGSPNAKVSYEGSPD
jgi:hypothetical protein